MFKFTRTGVNIISLIITTIIFFMIQIFIYQYTNGIEMNVEINEDMMQKQQEVIPEVKKTEETEIWKIEIEKISLKADIKQGTSKEILNKYIGHFEETQLEKGNIGLAAHNYTYNKCKKIYEVIKNRIIKDTDWEYLENTEENMLTLITCVENEPNYRRCVQAIEKEKEERY